MPMTVTITISAELKARIAELAAAKGVTLEEYAQEVLERYVETLTLREIFVPVRDQIKASGVTDEELAMQIEQAVTEVRTRHRS
jgi:predicted DNA-binding protein